MIIVEKNNLRLCTISKLEYIDPGKKELTCKDMPINHGLAIEKKCSDGNSYYVVSFVRYDDKEGAAFVEDVGTRILDIEDDEFEAYKKLISIAKDIVELQNR